MSPNRGACNGKMQGPGMFPGPCIFPHDTSPHIGRTIYPPEQANKRRTEKGGDTFRIRRYPAIFAVGRAARRREHGFRRRTGKKQGRTDNYLRNSTLVYNGFCREIAGRPNGSPRRPTGDIRRFIAERCTQSRIFRNLACRCTATGSTEPKRPSRHPPGAGKNIRKHMKRIACLILFVTGAVVCYGQNRVTLEECQLRARDNYPVIAQQGLIDQLEEFNISNARRNWLPKISLSAMAAYLSEVPEFPSTLNDLFSQLGVNLAAMPNTLYGTTVQIQQAIWDGGLIKAQTEAAKAESEVSRRSWESEMYALTERVNQLYFGSLLLQENIATADLMIEDLQRNYKMLESMAAFGTAEKNDLDMLKVEILGAQQQRAQLASTRTAYIAMLSIMTGLELTAATELEKPAPDGIPAGDGNRRPEFALLDAQAGLLDAQRRAVRASVMPQIGAFVLGAYSNPSPNIFNSMMGDGKWSPYLFAGISLKWNIDGFYTKKNRMSQIELNRKQLEMQRETLLYNIRLQSTRERAAIEQMEEVMRYDDEIILLRSTIRKRTEAQVTNGEGSVNDLLRDINAEERARQNKTAHEVEWLKNIYDLKYTINQ